MHRIFLIVIYWLKNCYIKDIQPLIDTILKIFNDAILNVLFELLKF